MPEFTPQALAQEWKQGRFRPAYYLFGEDGPGKAAAVDATACPVPPHALAGILRLLDEKAISSTVARDVFAELEAGRGTDPRAVVEARGWALVQDDASMAQAVQTVLADNPAQVATYRGGKPQVLGFLVGQAMKALGGKADARAVREALQRALDA